MDRDEELVRVRVAEIARAETASGFALGETITALTLDASKVRADAVQTTKDDATELPHLTLDMGTASGAESELALVGLLGEGGMGRVYVARQRSMRRDVAVKMLKPNATAEVARSLLREARMTGMLEHPGVIPVHALGLDDERSPMLVMKRIDGVSLADRIAKEGPLIGSNDRLIAGVETLIQLCRTIEFAHSRGVIHRDIKPENIMVGGFGEVYLVDWGIAILKTESAEGSIVGTPLYMAPEMVLGRSVDERTDVYLVGATLHEMLTGRPRHEEKTLMAIMRAAMLSVPYAYGPEVPEELARVCNRATAKVPADRPASAAAMRDALSAFLRHQSANALADAAVERVATLESLVASSGPLPDLAHAHRLAAEARFGLTESLRQDPTGPTAERGMRRLRGAAVDLELRQDHLEAAEALIAEIESPDADLVARVEACRERVASRTREHARLAELARDADPTVNAQSRSRRIVVLVGLTAIGGVVVVAFGPRVTPQSLLVAGVVIFVLLVTGMFIWRKIVLSNAFNRRIAGFAILAMGGIVCNRAAAMLASRPPDETLRHDLFLMGVVVIAGSISILRDIWICALVIGAGYAAIALWPELATPLFIMTTVVNLCVGAVVLARAQRNA